MGVVRLTKPAQMVGVDIVYLPKSDRGNRYVLVCIDWFSRFMQAYKIEKISAAAVEKKLSKFIQLVKPDVMVTDQGRCFISAKIQEMCQRYGVKLVHSTPYHPQGNAATERVIRTLVNILAKLSNENVRDWDKHLDEAVGAYLGTVHIATGFTPRQLAFETNKEVLKLAMEQTQTKQDKRQQKSVEKAWTRDINIGDEVLVYDRGVEVKDGKLASPWTNGWVVSNIPTPQTVVIQQKDKPQVQKTVSRSNVAPCLRTISQEGGIEEE